MWSTNQEKDVQPSRQSVENAIEKVTMLQPVCPKLLQLQDVRWRPTRESQHFFLHLVAAQIAVGLE